VFLSAVPLALAGAWAAFRLTGNGAPEKRLSPDAPP
jgi:hypothetical protein